MTQICVALIGVVITYALQDTEAWGMTLEQLTQRPAARRVHAMDAMFVMMIQILARSAVWASDSMQFREDAKPARRKGVKVVKRTRQCVTNASLDITFANLTELASLVMTKNARLVVPIRAHVNLASKDIAWIPSLPSAKRALRAIVPRAARTSGGAIRAQKDTNLMQ